MAMQTTIRALTSFLLPVAAAFNAAPAMAAPVPQQLEPAARWSLAVEPESCALSRTFGTGESQIVLQMEAFKPGDWFTIALIGAPLDKYTRTTAIGLRFLPDGAQSTIEPVAVRRIQVTSNGRPLSAVLLHAELAGRKVIKPGDELPPLAQADLARMNALSVKLGLGSEFQLQLGSMLAPVKALRGCVDNMVRRWGFDPAVAARPGGRPEPVGSPGEWATDNDYPPDAMARGIETDLHFRLSVDADGRVTDCVVQDRFPPAAFGELTCKLVRARARFRPARDTAGQPVASYFVSTVRWRIPPR